MFPFPSERCDDWHDIRKQMIKAPDIEKLQCVHCGDTCPEDHPQDQSFHFCCQGCQMVWQLLRENNLEAFYRIEKLPGISQRNKELQDYEFLDNKDIGDTLISFSSGTQKTIFLNLPDIHCTACIWLLEHLSRLEKGVLQCRVNFMQKKATIIFDSDLVSLKDLFVLLAKIGYPPAINLADKTSGTSSGQNRQLLKKIAVAGFCFGNIMLLSFPDYLGDTHKSFFRYIGFLNIGLALPVLLYSASDYFRSAWSSIKARSLGIDIPIVIGMLTLFLRSVYEIINQTGISYLDSFSGFVFFLLIGKWYQKYTYDHISFDRDYRSFLPLSAKVKTGNTWQDIRIEDLNEGDVILVRPGEIIPCDGMLHKGKASLDYSFITGESDPVLVNPGNTVNAGAKQLSEAIEITVSKTTEESDLTELWKNDIFSDKKNPESLNLLDKIGQYFTLIILVIAAVTLIYWLHAMPSMAFNAFTAVLIIACPCVLALSFPFLYGNTLRLLTQNGIFARDMNSLYVLSEVDIIVFDKTGTLTNPDETLTKYYGDPLSSQEMTWIKSACSYSHHPLSQNIVDSIPDTGVLVPDEFEEKSGKGIVARFGVRSIRLGSEHFILGTNDNNSGQYVFVEIDDKLKGRFIFVSPFRISLKENLNMLSDKFNMAVISGDNNHDQNRLESLLGPEATILFGQSPGDKLSYIKSLQENGHKVMMIGDGLNDAGALRQSDVAAVIAKDNHYFTPASDIIMNDEAFQHFPAFIHSVETLKRALFGAFAMAFLYNSIGLYFAVSGKLSPIVAAILMPASSLSIVFYGVVISYFIFRKHLRFM